MTLLKMKGQERRNKEAEDLGHATEGPRKNTAELQKILFYPQCANHEKAELNLAKTPEEKLQKKEVVFLPK